MSRVRTLTLRESEWTHFELDQATVKALVAMGTRLASDVAFWGDEPAEAADRSVIRVRVASGGGYEVRVANAVGVVRACSTQLVVQPKVPLEHFVFLWSQKLRLPRLSRERVEAATHKNLWELLANWFVDEGEHVLDRGLLKGYCETTESSRTLRGKVTTATFARDYYRGATSFECTFDDFTHNTPLNRVLRAAAVVVAGSQSLPWQLRRRALRMLDRMVDVDDMQPSDLLTSVDRLSRDYEVPVSLAKAVLDGVGMLVDSGGLKSWSFLVPSPSVVEDGVRFALNERLPTGLNAVKRQVPLAGSGLSVNPDLIFMEGKRVLDVKYKLLAPRWNRPDLYEVVVFGTALDSERVGLLGFAETAAQLPPQLQLEKVDATCLAWDTSIEPQAAADRLAGQVLDWLTEPAAAAK